MYTGIQPTEPNRSAKCFIYHNDPKFFGQMGLGKQCRPRLEQSDQGLHCLQFRLYIFYALLYFYEFYSDQNWHPGYWKGKDAKVINPAHLSPPDVQETLEATWLARFTSTNNFLSFSLSFSIWSPLSAGARRSCWGLGRTVWYWSRFRFTLAAVPVADSMMISSLKEAFWILINPCSGEWGVQSGTGPGLGFTT